MKALIMIFVLLIISISGQAQCRCLNLKKIDTLSHLVVPKITDLPLGVKVKTTDDNLFLYAKNLFPEKKKVEVFMNLDQVTMFIKYNDDLSFWGKTNDDFIRNRKFWLQFSSMFMFGACQQNMVYTRSKYQTFQKVYPNANPEFWSVAESSNNKYKNGNPNQGEAFWGSTHIFSGATDGYHLFATAANIFGGITLAIEISNYVSFKTNKNSYRITRAKKPWELLMKLGLLSLANLGGMELTGLVYDRIAGN